jgi:uncharacterized protein
MKSKLQAELITAMKAKNRARSDVIRAIISEIKYAEIEKGTEQLPSEDCLAIVQREIKKRKEELDFNQKSGRTELIEATNNELAILNEFMPSQLSSDEIEKSLIGFKEQNSGAAMGLAMKFLKEKFAGQYDAKLASELAKKIFN